MHYIQNTHFIIGIKIYDVMIKGDSTVWYDKVPSILTGLSVLCLSKVVHNEKLFTCGLGDTKEGK